MNWKKINYRIRSVCLLSVVVIVVVVWLNKETIFPHKTTAHVYRVEVLQIDANKYGYQIKKDERVFISQPFVPGVPGEVYFASADDAIRVGQLVSKRLEAGENISVTPEDFKQLGLRDFSK